MDKKMQKTVSDVICRVHKSSDFTILSNCFVRSTNIKCEAIGLLGKIMGLPKKWNFTIKGLEAICRENETAIRSALNELKKWGYMRISKVNPSKENKGRYKYYYDIYD